MSIIGHGVISRKAGERTEVEEIELDAPGPGEVLVKIQASGVCHTDLHYKLGKIGDEFPYLLGHEGSGIIQEVGEGVSDLGVGDYVVLAWRAPCGVCRFCSIGQFNLCAASLNAASKMRVKKGGQVLSPSLGIGTFCTHTIVAAKQAVKVPIACTPEQACLIGCGVMTGVGATLYTAQVRRGSSVAVYGCGGVGCSVIMGAKMSRASKIIAVDIADNKLAWAREFGATDVVNASETDPVEAIKDLTGGNGVDYSFEAVGTPQTLLQALWSRDLAGACTLIGVPAPDMMMELPMLQFFGLGGALRVSWYGDCLPSRDFPLLADWYEKGELDLDRMVTKVIGLEDVEPAFEAMERGETLRSVIRNPD